MTGIRQVKTTFTAGQVSRSLLGRGDLQAYQNGALTLHNVFIQPTGGVTRRAGLRRNEAYREKPVAVIGRHIFYKLKI